VKHSDRRWLEQQHLEQTMETLRNLELPARRRRNLSTYSSDWTAINAGVTADEETTKDDWFYTVPRLNQGEYIDRTSAVDLP